MIVAIDDQYMPKFKGYVKPEKSDEMALEMYFSSELL